MQCTMRMVSVASQKTLSEGGRVHLFLMFTLYSRRTSRLLIVIIDDEVKERILE